MAKDKKYFDIEAENRKQATSEQQAAKKKGLKKKVATKPTKKVGKK
jgi:hypothetical protein